MIQVGDTGYSVRWGAGTKLRVRKVESGAGSGGILWADITETYYNTHDQEIIQREPILFSEFKPIN